jgi:Transposase IS4
MARQRKPNLRSGSKVQEKARPHRHGTIVKASRESGKPHQWLVEFVQPDGSTVRQVKPSSGLLQPDISPIQPRTALNIRERSAPEETKAEELPRARGEPQEDTLSSRSSSSASASSSTTCSSDDSSSVQDVTPSFYDWMQHRQRENAARDDASILVDNDDSSYENEAPVVNEEAPIHANVILYRRDVNVEEDRTEDISADDLEDIESAEEFQRKTDVYLREKAQLLQDGWFIEMETAKPALAVGSRVRTRSAGQRQGVIVGKTDCGKRWLVEFNGRGGDVEERSPQSLVQIYDSETYVWKIVADSVPNNVDDDRKVDEDYADVGLVGFDFAAFSSERVSKNCESYQYPYLKLLQRLWGGDWMHHLVQLNQRIDAINDENKKTKKKNVSTIRQVTQREFWVFIGLMIAAGAHQFGGSHLWEKLDHRTDWTITEPINYGIGGKEVMAEYRFQQIRSYFPYAFQDKTAEAKGDPWHMIRGLVDGYNQVRSEWVAASIYKVLDECMSAWRPRTTAKGGLPHISYILRKPEPLGTEFKSVACSKTGIMLFLEIQEGKNAMATKEFTVDMGATGACSLRLIGGSAYSGQKWKTRKQAKDDGKAELFKGDSWFSGVPLVERLAAQGHQYIGAVKTNSRLYPKDELEEKMKDWPSGSYIVMECTTPDKGDKSSLPLGISTMPERCCAS